MPRGQEMAKMTSCQFLSTLTGQADKGLPLFPFTLTGPQACPHPLPEMPQALADPYPQGRVPALVADQEPVWPRSHLCFQQEVLAVYSERY